MKSWLRTFFLERNMGAQQPAETPCSPLGCILKHWGKFGGDPLTKKKLTEYCTQCWPKYKLDDGEKGPEKGSLNYNTILQLMLFCRRLDKWDEVPYVDLFFSLRNNHEIWKKCNLLTSDSNVMMIMEDIKKAPMCCSACSIGKKCLKLEEEEEDIQTLVAPDKESVTSGGGDSERGSEALSPIAGRTRAQQHPVVQTPLRQADGMPVYVKVPFTPEEKRMVIEKAREENEQQNARDGPDRLMPIQEPNWNLNLSTGRLMINNQHHQLILYGIKNEVSRPKNLAKLYQVVQGKTEDPSAFYERLCEVARKLTDLDSEDEANKITFTMLFVGQSAPGIRRKLQKVDGMSKMTISQLIEIAYKVYNNRDEAEKKEN
ncbi:anamorsin isoform X1 [Harpia harpyja]|uniref:anamorsin isoform X1 n=1 Tax=Harpia harpyja TaxID=202280 RepID=UPI0022B1DA80|nr:anamorsin isoform X1 [Harpia harpyja]XP_052651734.1 anamorsin isoform X1 [Harpia harpyja]XP_052651735.1 anamorsin isoform X1 [Harpia harpyja]XP_052651736.1 anamorsin isoform X1 [Harpia harpyja]